MASLANIRLCERERLRSLLVPGYMVQVSGPPMVGKVTLVKQTLADVERTTQTLLSSSLSSRPEMLRLYEFPCKFARSVHDVMHVMSSRLTSTPQPVQPLDYLTSVVKQLPAHQFHHVLVFERCESLVTNGAEHEFLLFLSSLNQRLMGQRATIVFTSYKRFNWSGPDSCNTSCDGMVTGPLQDAEGNICCTLEVAPLMDTDIMCALQHFAPAVNSSHYLHVFQRFLGFPEAVRKVAQTFLRCGNRAGSYGGCVPISSETLERKIKEDAEFLHDLFGSRVDEVVDWVGWENLHLLRHLGSSFDSSATRDCLRSVAVGETDGYRWARQCHQLERCYVIRELPGAQRVVVHPLVVYFCCTHFRAHQLAIRGRESNVFSTRMTQFLCRLLTTMDVCSQMRGQSRMSVVVGMINERPNFRHIIEMALHVNGDSYEAYKKLAVAGPITLTHLCPREATGFFTCLHEFSRRCGRSATEQAVLLGLRGVALSWGSGTAGSNSEGGERPLSEAIDILSAPDVPPSFYLLLFLTEKAKMQARKGFYDMSLRTYEQARRLFGRISTTALGEDFTVTESKLKEMFLSMALYETIPIIFKGNNRLAEERLNSLSEKFNRDFPNSIEMATLENQIGLNIQRGYQNLDLAMEYYTNSLNLRWYFYKVNPFPLYAPLNNLAMLNCRSRQYDKTYKFLQQALEISRSLNWLHFYTGLSLCHLAEVSIQRGHYRSAYRYLKEGERILSITSKDHDLRLKIFLGLAHVSLAIQHSTNQAPGPSSSLQQQPPLPLGLHQQHSVLDLARHLPEDGELVPGAADKCAPLPDLASVSCTDYLDRLVLMVEEMRGTLSDDGHHFILSAYEHAAALHWGSPQRCNEFKDRLFAHVQRYPFIRKLFNVGGGQRYYNLRKHSQAFLYLESCRDSCENLDLREFLSLIVPACTVCCHNRDLFTVDTWYRENNHRVRQQRDMEDLFGLQDSTAPQEAAAVPEGAPEGFCDRDGSPVINSDKHEFAKPGDFPISGISQTAAKEAYSSPHRLNGLAGVGDVCTTSNSNLRVGSSQLRCEGRERNEKSKFSNLASCSTKDNLDETRSDNSFDTYVMVGASLLGRSAGLAALGFDPTRLSVPKRKPKQSDEHNCNVGNSPSSCLSAPGVPSGYNTEVPELHEQLKPKLISPSALGGLCARSTDNNYNTAEHDVQKVSNSKAIGPSVVDAFDVHSVVRWCRGPVTQAESPGLRSSNANMAGCGTRQPTENEDFDVARVPLSVRLPACGQSGVTRDCPTSDAQTGRLTIPDSFRNSISSQVCPKSVVQNGHFNIPDSFRKPVYPPSFSPSVALNDHFNISDSRIASSNIPCGSPLSAALNEHLNITDSGGNNEIRQNCPPSATLRGHLNISDSPESSDFDISSTAVQGSFCSSREASHLCYDSLNSTDGLSCPPLPYGKKDSMTVVNPEQIRSISNAVDNFDLSLLCVKGEKGDSSPDTTPNPSPTNRNPSTDTTPTPSPTNRNPSTDTTPSPSPTNRSPLTNTTPSTPPTNRNFLVNTTPSPSQANMAAQTNPLRSPSQANMAVQTNQLPSPSQANMAAQTNQLRSHSSTNIAAQTNPLRSDSSTNMVAQTNTIPSPTPTNANCLEDCGHNKSLDFVYRNAKLEQGIKRLTTRDVTPGLPTAGQGETSVGEETERRYSAEGCSLRAEDVKHEQFNGTLGPVSGVYYKNGFWQNEPAPVHLRMGVEAGFKM